MFREITTEEMIQISGGNKEVFSPPLDEHNTDVIVANPWVKQCLLWFCGGDERLWKN